MALLLIELGESFAIAILDMLIDCEFPLTDCCLPQTMLSLIASPVLKEQLTNTTAICHFIAV